MSKLVIDSGEEWTFEKLAEIETLIYKINDEKYKLNIVPNSIEIISYEQMLDAYSRSGMPIGYDNWSFGESFLRQMNSYKANQSGLGYEIVLNLLKYNTSFNTDNGIKQIGNITLNDKVWNGTTYVN